MTTEAEFVPPTCTVCGRGKLVRRLINTHSVAARNAGILGIVVGGIVGICAGLSLVNRLLASPAGLGASFDLLVTLGAVGLVVLGFSLLGKKPFLSCDYCDATVPAF